MFKAFDNSRPSQILDTAWNGYGISDNLPMSSSQRSVLLLVLSCLLLSGHRTYVCIEQKKCKCLLQ